MMRGSKADELLTLVFMALAVATVVCLLFFNNRTYYMAFGGAAIILRIVQYILRYFR